jgi:hypothetical protein
MKSIKFKYYEKTNEQGKMSFKDSIIVLDNNSVWGTIILNNVSSIEVAPRIKTRGRYIFNLPATGLLSSDVP